MKRVEEFKKDQEEVDFTKIGIETSKRLQNDCKNNLELYLNDVYEYECLFKIEQEEVNFIQKGIEKLVKKVVNRVVEDVSVCASLSINQCYARTPQNRSILKAYFSIPDDSFLHKYKTADVDKIPTEKCSIICVGSFYDRTKNSFPDEFDFIFPLLDCNRHMFPMYDDHLEDAFTDALKQIADDLKFPLNCKDDQVNRQLTYDKYLEIHGPAYKLRFRYDSRFGYTRFIHVDIVPAERVFGMNRESWFVNNFNCLGNPKTFCENMFTLRSCLFVDRSLAFTEVEKKFMTSILSKKHVKVYRVLKYLLNGHGDNKELPKWEDCYCSYRIKVFMIYHHDDCEHADCEDLAPCVLQVLEEISRYKHTAHFPSLTFSEHGYTIPDTLLSCLKSLIADLHGMQTSVDSYDYEKNNSVAWEYRLFFILNLSRVHVHEPTRTGVCRTCGLNMNNYRIQYLTYIITFDNENY